MGARDMTYPSGKLTERDLTNALPNCAESLPFPLETEPAHIGEHAKKPAPPRMWDEERESPWLFLLYVAALLGTLLVSHLLARH